MVQSDLATLLAGTGAVRRDVWRIYFYLSFSVIALQKQHFYRRVFKVTFVTVRSWGFAQFTISIAKGEEG